VNLLSRRQPRHRGNTLKVPTGVVSSPGGDGAREFRRWIKFAREPISQSSAD